MEYGSLSDWVSSLSTLGTFVIAVMAYKAAPDWISKKEHDLIFEIASEKIPEIKKNIEELNDKLSFFSLDSSRYDEVFWNKLYDLSEENISKNVLAEQSSVYKSKISLLSFNRYPASKSFKSTYVDLFDSTIKYSNSVFALFSVIAVFGKESYSRIDWITDDFKILISGLKESIDSDYKSVIQLLNEIENISEQYLKVAKYKA
ncbi:hypothetical protein [Providencia rettgeri]|uniref:hypothetical protein n=1 Tax=Providencia rettgeri TaxID=587 RepID=UPI001BA535C7|nr:hypothetical protein [Providencia rettgeri]MBS0861931.1 hypothetical protein [Providencia rettgeri]MBS0875660.1 hypothetical protein [Providencia rettgeri]MBS0922800.1 hypothetical protein [Providencia rettgeri]